MTEYLSHLMYLRKSRQDDPNETIEEVLAKHENILQEYAMRELGGRIPEQNIYREIVSGESIDDREEIQKILSVLEDPNIKGVLCMEPSRLSRGDLADCSRIMNAFRFTHTLIVTPYMTYNIENKMERKFFQDELLRGNDYLEYTKEILWRGRVASAKRGCFIGSTAPYGYDKILIGKDHTLKPNENAPIVRMIFDWYVKDDMTPNEIARKLNDMGIPPIAAKKWGRCTIKDMLDNIHYIGKVRFNEVKLTYVMENGVRVKKFIKQPSDEIIIAEGKHPGIIEPKIYEAAVQKLSSAPKVNKDRDLINILSSILRCKECGKVLILKTHPVYDNRYGCRSSCHKSTREHVLINALVEILEQHTLPDLYAKLEGGADEEIAMQKKKLNSLIKQMEEYREQEENQYDLLETGKYTQEVFDKRNAKLREKMEECEKNIHLTRNSIPKNIDYGSSIKRLQDALAGIKDDTLTGKEKNRLLRAIIERIDYSARDLGHNQVEFDLGIHLKR